jgi:hypothetical protein
VASLSRYLNDSQRFWVFYVDDVTGVSISFGAWPRGGGAVPGTAGGGSPSTDHSLTTSRNARTSDAGTLAPPTPTTISVAPPPDSGATPPDGPGTRDSSASKDTREKRQARLGSGIRDIGVAPGPRGVKLSFHTDQRARVRVQFSKEPPSWNGREGRWEYRGGQAGPWFASIERAVGTPGYVAIPHYRLESGARYHYLITVFAGEESPERQRTGAFTARVKQ